MYLIKYAVSPTAASVSGAEGALVHHCLCHVIRCSTKAGSVMHSLDISMGSGQAEVSVIVSTHQEKKRAQEREAGE